MKNSFESNLIKIPAKDVVDELYGKPPTKGERDIAEFRKKKIGKPEKMESQKLFENLKTKEIESLEQFFGMEIEVLDLPEEITPEKYREWRKMKFGLHYLPEIDMTEDNNFPGWRKKPENLFEYIKNGNVSKDATKLKPGWILIDERAKPQYEDGKQAYENDPLFETIKQLRTKGIIQNYKIDGSRFNINNDELQKETVRESLADVLRVNSKAIRLPMAIEWNFLGNAYYKEWGDTNTWEWFEDKYEGLASPCSLHSGRAGSGDLSLVICHSTDHRDNRLAFRPLVRFPEK